MCELVGDLSGAKNAVVTACLAEVYAIGSEEEEKTTPHLSCEINGVQCKALCNIEAQVSFLLKFTIKFKTTI
jgi:hypothetical protein